MDAAAHGGQIACELNLALAVVMQWQGRAASACSSGGLDPASIPQATASCVNLASQPMVVEHPRAKSAPGVPPLPPVGDSQAGVQARQEQHQEFDSSTAAVTLMSLGSVPPHRHHQQQQHCSSGPLLAPILSAAPSLASAADDSQLLLGGVTPDHQEDYVSSGLTTPFSIDNSSIDRAANEPDANSETAGGRFAWLIRGNHHTHGSVATDSTQPPSGAAAAAAAVSAATDNKLWSAATYVQQLVQGVLRPDVFAGPQKVVLC